MRTSWVFWLDLAAVLVGMGSAKAEEKPQGKPPLVMKVVKVNADHLVVQHVEGGFFSQTVTTWTPSFSTLRVYDREGQQLEEATWKKRIRAGLKVYVAADEKTVDPTHLKKADKDALVLWGVVIILMSEPVAPDQEKGTEPAAPTNEGAAPTNRLMSPPTPIRPISVLLPRSESQAAAPGQLIRASPGGMMGRSIDSAQAAAKTQDRKASTEDRYVGELLDILERTQSSDAFVVTLRLLVEMNAGPRRVVPVAIRNAERLGIFARNHLFEKDNAKGDPMAATAVSQAIGELAKARPKNESTMRSNPEQRIKDLLNQSEDLRQIKEEWERIWKTDQPSHLTPERVDGGIP